MTLSLNSLQLSFSSHTVIDLTIPYLQNYTRQIRDNQLFDSIFN